MEKSEQKQRNETNKNRTKPYETMASPRISLCFLLLGYEYSGVGTFLLDFRGGSKGIVSTKSCIAYPPTQDASYKWRFSSGFSTKNKLILVVILGGGGSSNNYVNPPSEIWALKTQTFGGWNLTSKRRV